MCGIYSKSYIPFIKQVELKTLDKIEKKNVVSEKIFGMDIDEFLEPYYKELK